MSIAGSLSDVAVADLVQFIHMGGRTGTLALEAPHGRAEIGFYRGQIVSALSAGIQRLGDILLAVGAIDQATLEAALRSQAATVPRPALGQVLLSQGAITQECLYDALREHLAQSLKRVIGWNQGTFQFRMEDLHLVDGLSMSPAALLPHIDLNTQMVVLEALRLFDERNRTPLEPAAPPVAAPPPPTPFLRVQVVSRDASLVGALAELFAESTVRVVRVALRDAGAPPPGEPPPVVLIDVRRNALTPEAIQNLRRSRPRARVVALVDSSRALAPAFDAGARAVVTADLPVLRACLDGLLREHADLGQEQAIASGISAGFSRLRRVLTDLRAGLVSATMSLQLMSIISESVDRAIFFMLRRDVLLALGAFGLASDGSPLATVTRGLQLGRDGSGLISASLAEGRPRSALFEEAQLPPLLTQLVGRPSSGQVVVFPVAGRSQAVAAIYTDNGPHNRVIDQVDVLELATTQLGMAFESELLLRRASQ